MLAIASVSRLAVRPVAARAALSFSLSTSARRAAPPAPEGAAAAAKAATPKRPDSILAAGTTMEGLSVLKDKPDPVALEDDEYPAWLWTLLDAPASGGKEGEFDFVAERRRLRAQNRAGIKAANFLKTT